MGGLRETETAEEWGDVTRKGKRRIRSETGRDKRGVREQVT